MYYRKIFFPGIVFFTLLLTLNLNAQKVTIELHNLPLPSNQFYIENLWQSIYLTNNTGESIQVKLRATVKQIEEGETIFIGCSAEFLLEANYSNYVNQAVLDPIHVEDYNSEYEEIALRTGTLPAGSYEICVAVGQGDVNSCDNFNKFDEQCPVQIITHSSPPELINPFDLAEVFDELPLFTWLPPTPAIDQLKYTLRIVEILDGQTPIEAMEANYAWFLIGEEGGNTEIDFTSFQYPIDAREFDPEITYAWKVIARSGADIIVGESPVWSFKYVGPAATQAEELVQIELISPANKAVTEELPYFEWGLDETDPMVSEVLQASSEVLFELKIWQRPETFNEAATDEYSLSMQDMLKLDPFYYKDDLYSNTLTFSRSESEILIQGYTYYWNVVARLEDRIIGESEVQEFFYIKDAKFIQAADLVLNSVELNDLSNIYGVVDPLSPGAVVASEHPLDIEKIIIGNESFLFIIDDEPYSRYSHPVRYVLVEKETDSMSVYEANWFPVVENTGEYWKTTGETEIKNSKINAIKGVSEDPKQTYQPRQNANMEDYPVLQKCNNNAIIIDAGDKNRLGLLNTPAQYAAIAAEQIEKIYDARKFKVYRFSQFWDYKDLKIKQIPVDPGANSGARFLRFLFTRINEYYATNQCCDKKKSDHELLIYLIANGIPNTTKFKLYKADGSGICEDMDYREDILKHLQKLPQCVKIKLVIDACYSGVVADTAHLTTILKRDNYEILTATDSKKTTDSGLGRASLDLRTAQQEGMSGDELKSAKEREKKKSATSQGKSFTDCYAEAYSGKKRLETIGESIKIMQELTECWRLYLAEVDKEFTNPQHTISSLNN